MKNKKKIIIIILVLFISIGFAYLSTTLNINGAVTFNENNWDIHFENIKLINADASYTTLEIDSNDNTKINTAINFKEPSEVFEYSVDIVNAGGIDAVFDSITNIINSTIEDYITIETKYYDGSTINKDDLLRMGQSKKIKVKVIYNLDIDELPAASTTSITTALNYENVNLRNISYNRKVWNYEFTGYEQVFITPKTGNYKVELWGAQGGGHWSDPNSGGEGAYVSGKIELTKGEKFYVYVGETPSFTAGACYATNSNNTFNGSKWGGCAIGGGATDIRLLRGSNWYNNNSLASRIMVAGAGGGGYYCNNASGGAGGGLRGIDAVGGSTGGTPGKGATQKKYYFGYHTDGGTSLGGAGYYSGSSGAAANAGGGSSFISGYKGCIAITAENDLTPICEEEDDPANQDITCSYHYSGYKFTDGVMIAGNESMKNPDGTTTTGHYGNGYARFTLIN